MIDNGESSYHPSDEAKSDTAEEMPKATGQAPAIELNPRAPQLPHGPSKDTFQYFVTLTAKSGFTASEIKPIVGWHKHNSSTTLLVKELTSKGFIHLHSIITTTCKTTNQITRKLQYLWKTQNMELSKASIKVKKCTHFLGMFHYLTKDLASDGSVLYIKGWKMSWIQEQVKDSLKSMPKKMLLKGDYCVTLKNGTALLVEYAERTAMPLVDKFSFARLVSQMASEGYTFDNCKLKFLFTQVMARKGDRKWMECLVLNELQYLDA